MPAVVARTLGTCRIEALDLRPLEARDVLVRIDASGICHSDVAVLTGDLARPLPVVLGHEGAGTVMEVGSAVSAVRPGDRVVLAAIPSCGRCWFCSRGEPENCETAIKRPPFRDGGGNVDGTSGLGTLSDAVVVDERAVVKVESDLPAEQLSMLGCAVLTGTGSALNYAKASAGSSILVIGAGGVGLAAVQGARSQGASPIAVIDPSDAARAGAQRCGATHAVAPGPEGEAALLEATKGRGFDAVIDMVSTSGTLEAAWRLARRGGTIVVVGVSARSQANTIPIVDIALTGRKLVGCVYGGSSVHRDIPRYAAMAERGELDFAALLGRTITLAEAPAILMAPAPLPGRTVVVN